MLVLPVFQLEFNVHLEHLLKYSSPQLSDGNRLHADLCAATVCISLINKELSGQSGVRPKKER